MKKSLHPHLLPYIKKGRFYNHPHDVPESVLFHTIPSFFSSLRNRRKRAETRPLNWVVTPHLDERSQEPRITWLGHASFLIQINSINIITDPVFGDLSWLFRRMTPSPLLAHQLPPIDVVLLSHNHPDHTDLASLKQLSPNHDRWYGVAKGDKAWMDRHNLGHVEEFSWWEQSTISTAHGAVTVTFLPAHHWSARGLLDCNRSLWGSWMIQTPEHTIYFGGDTAYWKHFKAIAQEFPAISVALLPVGPCEPSKWMSRTHMNPEQAIQAGLDLNCRSLVPMHWGAFSFGLDHFDTSSQRLLKAWEDVKPADMKLELIKTGQTIEL